MLTIPSSCRARLPQAAKHKSSTAESRKEPRKERDAAGVALEKNVEALKGEEHH